MRRRFVIQNHTTADGGHFDLMLEAGGALATWRLSRLPGGEAQAAERLGDHRLAYLEYEGEISGGRGRVEIADRGSYRLLDEGDDLWRFELAGRRVRGHKKKANS